MGVHKSRSLNGDRLELNIAGLEWEALLLDKPRSVTVISESWIKGVWE